MRSAWQQEVLRLCALCRCQHQSWQCYTFIPSFPTTPLLRPSPSSHGWRRSPSPRPPCAFLLQRSNAHVSQCMSVDKCGKGSPCPNFQFSTSRSLFFSVLFMCPLESNQSEMRPPYSKWTVAEMATLRWGPAEVVAWATARGVSDEGAKTLVANHIDGATLMYLDEVGGCMHARTTTTTNQQFLIAQSPRHKHAHNHACMNTCDAVHRRTAIAPVALPHLLFLLAHSMCTSNGVVEVELCKANACMNDSESQRACLWDGHCV